MSELFVTNDEIVCTGCGEPTGGDNSCWNCEGGWDPAFCRKCGWLDCECEATAE